MSFYQWQAQDLLLNVYVQPRASCDEITGLHGDHLKIRITAPPVDSKANVHLQKFLAKLFQIPASKIMLISGDTQRHKRIRVVAPEKIPPAIKQLLKS